jgi:hypothetical protein
MPVERLEVGNRKGLLLQVILALHQPGRFPRRLHRRQQQRDQYADDCNNHKQLDERKRQPAMRYTHVVTCMRKQQENGRAD